jgi:RNA polymerase sigma-70 factor (ECF subfamily)
VFFTGPAAVRLYDDHVDAVHRYLARRLGADHAIPLVGETFAIAVSGQGPPNNTAEMERTWLLGIATDLLHRHDDIEEERLATWAADETGREAADPLLETVAADSETAVLRAAATLRPDDRDLLFLTVWEGYPIQAAARVAGLSTGATSSALKRIRRELRKRAATVSKNTGPAPTPDDPGLRKSGEDAS